jgi:hypothetical protein
MREQEEEKTLLKPQKVSDFPLGGVVGGRARDAGLSRQRTMRGSVVARVRDAHTTALWTIRGVEVRNTANRARTFAYRAEQMSL